MKLFILIFCSIIACVMTVGYLAYSKAKEVIEQKVSDASVQTVAQVANNLDTVYRTYEDLTLKLMFDADFHELVRQVQNNDPEYTKSEYTGKLTDRVKSYMTGNISINGMLMIPIDARLAALEAGAAQTERAELLRETEWFKQVVEQDGLTLWIPPQPEGLVAMPAPSNIGISRLIKDTMSNQPSYVLVMEIHTAAIAQRFADISMGEGSEMAILDGAGRYIYTPNKERIGKPADIRLPAGGDAAQSGAMEIHSSTGTDLLAAYAAFERMDWKLVGTVPVEELVRDAKAIQSLTWITGAVAALLAIAIGIVVLRTIARPLVRLRNRMNEGASGNLTVRSDIGRRRDEIGEM
jgi:methyl-accepting chemotaxis protein